MSDGHEIVVEKTSGVDEQTLRYYLMGSGLAVLLYQRGLLVLHGNAVEMEGRAVALLGHAGSGKSTISAALYARGHGIISDDVTAIQFDSRVPTVVPGFPQLKLWPGVAAYLGDDPSSFPRVRSHSEKLARPVPVAFPQCPLPLARVYVLSDDPPAEVGKLRPQDALSEALRHTYCVRVGQPNRWKHFLQCGRLAGSVVFKPLPARCSLSTLPDLVRFIEEDVRGGF